MEEAVKNKAIIDIDMQPNWDSIYCGICLSINDQNILMLNFNEELGAFDGFTLLNTKDLGKYRTWELDEYTELKNDNKDKLLSSIRVEDFKDLKSALSNLTEELISIFTYEDNESFFVGKIEKMNENSFVLKLINEDSEWIGSQEFEFDEISYLGFRTVYEYELTQKDV
jgi:hypothetical protein